MGSSKLTYLILHGSTLQDTLNKRIYMFSIQYVAPCHYSLMIVCSHFLLFLFLKRFDYGLYTMDYMDTWNGKKMVGSSLEQVCVAIQKISYCNSYFVSKYACSVLLSFLFFIMSLPSGRCQSTGSMLLHYSVYQHAIWLSQMTL